MKNDEEAAAAVAAAVADSEGEECEHNIRQEMRRLSETSESRRLRVFQTNKQLKEAQETLKDLRKAIKFKVTNRIKLHWYLHSWNRCHLQDYYSKYLWIEWIELNWIKMIMF